MAHGRLPDFVKPMHHRGIIILYSLSELADLVEFNLGKSEKCPRVRCAEKETPLF